MANLKKKRAVRPPAKADSSTLTLNELYKANVPLVISDEIFESRLKRAMYLILSDYQNVFLRTGIYQDTIRFSPSTFLEYFEGVTRIMLLSLYRSTWDDLHLDVGRLSTGKISAMLRDLVLPDYVLSLIYPLLQPIMIGNSVLIPGPNCYVRAPRSNREDTTLFGAKLNNYNPTAADYGAYIRVGAKFGFTNLFVGVKTPLATVQLEKPTITTWPILFKYVKTKLDNKGLPIRTPVPSLYSFEKPITFQEAERAVDPTITEFQYEAWNAEFTTLKNDLLAGADDFSKETYSWYFPNCHANRDPHSYAYCYSILARVEITSECNMRALTRQNVGFHNAEFSSIGILTNRTYSRSNYLNAYAIFESIYARREQYGRVTINETCLNEARMFDFMVSEMLNFWNMDVYPTIQDSFVFEFPRPILGGEFATVGTFTVPAHTMSEITVKTQLPKKTTKAAKQTNVSQNTEEPAEPIAPDGIG